MKISVNWLKDYVKTGLSPAEIAEKLTLTGLEVEETTQSGSSFEGVVVGEVLEVNKHPNADRLTVCKVNTGGETVQIVCGAPNVHAGQKVAVATVGTELPLLLDDGSRLKIRKSKIRGQVSEGMICSEDELGLGTDHSGIIVLDDGLVPGTPFSEISGNTLDHVLEIGLTPNRPDAACHAGTARDLHAVTGEEVVIPSVDVSDSQVAISGHPSISIYIDDVDLCHRYVGVVMRGVTVKESPAWVQNRLRSIGLRPRNAIVDATNYVLHELGQPLHAFDLTKLAGAEIRVKTFDKDTKFTTLDDVERDVPAGSLFICDGQKPVAIAGIMGGVNSEINEATSDILIESAWFNPVSVRKTSKQIALQSDSSYRFERGVDPTITRSAALRCAELIREWAGGEIEFPVVDVHPKPYEPAEVTLRLERLNQITGMEFDAETPVRILGRLGFQPQVKNGNIDCQVPGRRPDVTGEIDLIEEVARIYDYNNIPTTGRITFAKPPILPFEEEFLAKIRTVCTNLGLQEIYTNSLLPESLRDFYGNAGDLIPTLNPISRDQSILRPSLRYGFLRTAAWNFNRKQAGIRGFEIGHVFSKGDGTWINGINERRSLLIGLGGLQSTEHWKNGAQSFTFGDLRSTADALMESLRINDRCSCVFQASSATLSYDGTIIANLETVGKELLKKFDIDEDIFIAEFDLDALMETVRALPPLKYQPVPKFPPFEFDIALVVDKQVNAATLEDSIRRNAGKLLENIGIFDVFEGKPLQDNEKSIAFRLMFRDADRTLAINDIEPIINRLVKKLGKETGAKLRD